MEKKSLKKNYLYNVLYQLLLILLPIITTPYLARKLGSYGIGIYGYTVSIVTYFILFGSLGISMYGQREIAYNQNNREKRSNIFWELVFIRIITMSLSAIIFYLIFCIKGQYAIYYKILLLELLANILDISWFYQGMEEFKKTVIKNFIVKMISVICIFMFIKSPADINKYLFIYTGSILFGSLTLWFGINKYINKPNKIKLKYHIPLIISLFIPQIAIQIYTVLDKTMLGIILNDMSEVGYYEQSQKIIRILLSIITALGTVMMPRIASCYAEGDYNKIKNYMKKTFNFIFMFSLPLMFGIIAVSNNFVPIFFGKGYEKVSIIMSILCPIVVFISISNVTGTQFLLPTKRQKEFTLSAIVGAVINFVLNIILIQKFKSNGAALATLVAELVVVLIQLYFIKKDFDLKEIFSVAKKYLIASIIMFIICLFIDYIISSKLIGIIIQVFIGIIVYFIMLFVLKDKFLIDFLNKYLKNRMK